MQCFSSFSVSKLLTHCKKFEISKALLFLLGYKEINMFSIYYQDLKLSFKKYFNFIRKIVSNIC